MITTAVQLAHNILRLSNFDYAERPLFNSYQAALTPITAKATYQFIAAIGTAFNIVDASTDSLSEIFGLSVRAYLHARAYDQTYAFDSFTTQFIAAYAPTSYKRAQFIGAHPARVRAYTLYILSANLPAEHNITLPFIDTLIKRVISNELLAIDVAYTTISTPLRAVEQIDVDILKLRHEHDVIAV